MRSDWCKTCCQSSSPRTRQNSAASEVAGSTALCSIPSQLATTRKSLRAAPPRSEFIDTHQPRLLGTDPVSTSQMCWISIAGAGFETATFGL
jgi:hypothetical protein